MAKKPRAASAAKASDRETNDPIDNFLEFLARLIAREHVRRHAEDERRSDETSDREQPDAD